MVEYDSAKSPPAIIDELVQLIRYRYLVFLMTGNILKNRYKRSMLGIFWMLLNPLLQTIVLTIAFGTMFKSSLSHYAIYLLSGLLVWNFITQTTQYAMGTMAYGGGLLKKIYVPRATYIVAAVGNGMVNFFISIFSLIIIIIFLDHPLGAAWFFIPISILILTIFTFGFSLLLSTASVFFTDTLDIYQVLIQALFFLTPIMYPLSILSPELSQFLAWNPFLILIEMFRTPIYANHLPDTSLIVNAVSLAFTTLLAGWIAFTSKADQLAYRL